MELQQDCRTTKDRQDCTKTLGDPQTASKCRPFAPEPASHRNRSGITERHPPKTLRCRRNLLQSRNNQQNPDQSVQSSSPKDCNANAATVQFTANLTIPTDQPKSITFSLRPVQLSIPPAQHNAIHNPHAILVQSRNPSPIRERWAREYRTRSDTRQSPASSAASSDGPIGVSNRRRISDPTPVRGQRERSLQHLKSQSTIPSHSCCNHKITQQSVNVGPENIEPGRHPGPNVLPSHLDFMIALGLPHSSNQGWYTTQSQGHSIKEVFDQSRAVHHSITDPLNHRPQQQSKTQPPHHTMYNHHNPVNPNAIHNLTWIRQQFLDWTAGEHRTRRASGSHL